MARARAGHTDPQLVGAGRQLVDRESADVLAALARVARHIDRRHREHAAIP